MGKVTKLGFEIERYKGKKDEFDKIKKETYEFYNQCQAKSESVNLFDVTKAVEAIKQLSAERDRALNGDNKNAATVEYVDLLNKELSIAEEQFSNIGVLVQSSVDKTKRYVSGLHDIMSAFDDRSLSIVLVDINRQFEQLQERANNIVNSLLESGSVVRDWGGKLAPQNMDVEEFEQFILKMQELQQVQQQMLKFDPNMQSDSFASGNKNLNPMISQMEKDLADMRQFNISTTQELKQRKNLIREFYNESYYYHDDAKNNIKDEETYKENIELLENFISQKQQLLEELYNNEHLFSEDEVFQYSSSITEQIEQHQMYLQELQTLKQQIGGQDGGTNLNELIEQLTGIVELINDIKIALEPISNAFSAEGTALNKMATEGATSLETLLNKLMELEALMDSINKKEFNSTMIFNQKDSSKVYNVEQMDAYKEKAQTLLEIVKQLIEAQDVFSHTNTSGYSMALSKQLGVEGMMSFFRTMENFDLSKINGKIAGSETTSAMKKVIGELEGYYNKLMEVVNGINKIHPNAINLSSLPDMSGIDKRIAELQKLKNGGQIDEQKNKFNNALGGSSVLQTDAKSVSKGMQEISQQLETDLDAIKNQIQSVFNFDYINPNYSNINSIIENIYTQFQQLSERISGLDFNIPIGTNDLNAGTNTTPNKADDDVNVDNINKTTNAIKEEGKVAEVAAIQKEEFVNANKQVAQSANGTPEKLEQVTNAIKEEGKASIKAAESFEQLVTAQNNATNGASSIRLKGRDKESFEAYAKQIADSKGMTLGPVSVQMVKEDEDERMSVATVKMLNEQLQQSVTYTYQLKEIEDGVTEAYLTGFRVVGDTSKALRQQALEQKRADKVKAQNQKWLIQQQSSLDSQVRSYTTGNKTIDGNTSLMSVESSLEDQADATINSLVQHIRNTIKNAMQSGLTNELTSQILNDMRILKNEIGTQQNMTYSSTTMKASTVETNKAAYKEYLNAFEARSKKFNVFDQMKQDIAELRKEIEGVSDAKGLDQFVEKVKVARNKLSAEHAKQSNQTSQEKELNALYEKQAEIVSRIAINKSKLNSGEVGEKESEIISKIIEDDKKEIQLIQQKIKSYGALVSTEEQHRIITEKRASTLQKLGQADAKSQDSTARKKIEEELNALYKQRENTIREIIKYQQQADTMTTQAGKDAAQRILELATQRLQMLNKNINSYGDSVNTSILDKQDANLTDTLRFNSFSNYTQQQEASGQAMFKQISALQKLYYDAQIEYEKATEGSNAELKALEAVLEIEDAILNLKKQANLTEEQSIQLANEEAIQQERLAKSIRTNDAKSENKTNRLNNKMIDQYFSQYSSTVKSIYDINPNLNQETKEQKMLELTKERKVIEERLLTLGVDVNKIESSSVLTEEYKNKLLQKQLELWAQISKKQTAIVDREEIAQNKRNLNYGKAQYNNEEKQMSKIIGKQELYNGDDSIGLSDGFNAKITEYVKIVNQMKQLRNEFASNSEMAKDPQQVKAFQKLAVQAELARKEINGVFASIEMIENLPEESIIRKMNLEPQQLNNTIQTMKQFASTAFQGKAAIKGWNEAGTEMYVSVDRGKGVVDQCTISINKATGQMVAYKTSVKNAGTAWERFTGGFKSKLASLIQYLSWMTSIYMIMGKIRQGFEYIKGIDSALTELKKVTDETAQSYSNFLDDMAKTASVVGSTITDLTNSAADWARLGYSMKEAGDLAKNTAILMNVSEFDDVQTATEAMISSLQAFNYSAGDSIKIVDKLNIIGNNFAISSDGIAEGLKRSASTLVAAGNSLEQSIAMLAAGNKVVQDPENLGNALKVLSMRIRGTKTELEEAGESTEGMIENTSKLRDKVKALTNVDGNGGVDILADDGSFRSTYDILLDIAKIWDKINKADPKNQAALLEILAGKTRGSQLAAVLQNPQDLEAAYNMAQNSNGSALEENEKYLNSIQGKIDLLTNSVQTFWHHLVDSSSIKIIIDFLRNVINLIDKIGVGTTALLTIFAKLSFDSFLRVPISMAFDSLKGMYNEAKGIQTVLQSFGEVNKLGLTTFLGGKVEAANINVITAALDDEIVAQEMLTKEVAKQILVKNGVAEADIEGALAAMGFTGANAGLATSFKAVGKTALTATKAVLKFLFTNPVGWAILATTAIVGVTSAIKKAKEEAREAAEEAIDTYKEAENAFTSNKSTLDSISDDYQRLSKGVDQFGKNISLTTDEYARYNEITNKIADMFPDMVEGYTKEGNAIIKMKGNVDELTKAYERAAEASRYELLSKGNEIFSTAKDDITNYDNKIGATDAARQLLNGSTIESIMKQYGEKVTSEARKLLEDVGAKSYIGYYASGKQYESYGLEQRFNTQTQKYEDSYTNEEYNEWAAARNKLELEYNQILGEKEAILSKVNTVLQAYIASDSTYSALEEQMQNAVSVIASSLDPKDFNYNDDAMEGFIKNNIIVPIYENQDGIQSALNKLLTIDESSTSYQMYQSLKQALLNAIQNLPEETQIAIKAAFKIGENSEYDIDVNHVKDILQDEFDDKVGEMSIGDLKLAGEIEVKDGALLSWDELNNKIELARATAVKSKADFEQLNGSIDSIQSAYSALRDAVTEYNTNGYLTLDTLQSILTLEPEYLACLQFENGQLVLNQEAMRQMVEQRLNEAEATAIQNAIVQINTLTENANAEAAVNVGAASDGAIGGVANLGYAMSATGSQALEASGKLREFWAAAQNAKSAGVDISAIQDVVSSLDATINMIHNTRSQLSTSNFGSVMNYKPSSSGSGSGSGSNSNSSKEFDFIDIYFKNLENKISENQSKLANLLDDTSAINTKNKLSEEIESYYKQEAASAQKVAEYYTKQAASTLSKIPAKYREAIKNGSLDVATISDDSLNDLLTKYRDYVDKASSYTQKYWDTLEEIANKAKEKFDDIKSDYDNKISFTDLFRNQIQNEIDVAEEAGETISTAYYEALIENNKEKLKTLKEEQKQLLKILQSGDVRVGTDQYYEMVSALDDVDSAINECEKDTISWTNAINEIKAEQFDKLIDKIKEVNDEISNVYDLISDDDKIADEFGNWTKEGITALGLLVQQMQNAEYAADEIGKEIASLNPKDFASYEKYEDRLKELNEAQWEEIQASESAKDAIKNLNSARIDSVKNALEKEIDAYEELINKKKEALEADKDLYDFEKSVAEQQKDIATIQRKLAALANDSSASATAQRRKLEANLLDANAKLEDSYRDRSYDNTQNALDVELKAKQDAKDEEIKRLENYLKDTEKLIQDSLVNVLTNADVILQELNEISDTYGVSLSDNLKSPWIDAAEEAKVYKENISSDLLELMNEDGILDTFDLNATEYLTSPFISGEEAAKTFKNTVVTQLDGVKTGLKQAYDDAVVYNNNIINACNQAIAAYKKVQQQSTVAAAAIKTQNIPSSSSSSSSGGSSGGGGGGNDATMNYVNTTSWVNGHAFTSERMTYDGITYAKDADGYWVNENYVRARSAQNVKRYKYYAKGTKSVKKDQWAFTDEPWLGEEITLHAGPNGNLQYLTKGSGVLAADVTERLMNLANSDLDPTEMLNRSRPVISAPQLTKNEFSIDMNIAEVIHIDHADSDSIPDIQKAVQTQMDKYMGKLNNSLRKFTR